MGLEQLGVDVIEQLIAAFPQLTVIISILIYFVKMTKNKISTFPDQLKSYQTEISGVFTSMKTELTNAFTATKTELTTFVKGATEEFGAQVKQLKEDIHKEVGAELEKMKGELANYQSTLANMTMQNNMMVKENKLFADMIAAFVSKDPKMIRNGIAEIICAKTNLTREELEHYPEMLVSEIKVLETAMKETLVTIGKEEFEKLLRSIGYVPENKNPEL